MKQTNLKWVDQPLALAHLRVLHQNANVQQGPPGVRVVAKPGQRHLELVGNQQGGLEWKWGF